MTTRLATSHRATHAAQRLRYSHPRLVRRTERGERFTRTRFESPRPLGSVSADPPSGFLGQLLAVVTAFARDGSITRL